VTYKRTEKVNGKYRFIHELECLNCGEFYERVGANKKPIKNGHCTRECRKELFKKTSWTVNTCTQCKKKFKTQISRIREFCSHKCYHANMKENPEKYKLLSRAENMRNSTDKLDATKKMLDTKLEKGLIVDWNNATWKQWYRRCNSILQKRRKEMVGEWDGYDYIDNKYIKDNFNLPYYHKDYPTLDHLIPKQALFKEGYTPEEACKKENLRWTTRSNNSKKGY
jgi:endogenous inhibitor of DNA gyrase (YacG/DUF329 family)